MLAERLAAAPCRPGFAARMAVLREECAALWRATPAVLPELGPPSRWRRRYANGRAAARLIDGLGRAIESYPEDVAARPVWRAAIRDRLQSFGEARLGWPAGYRRLLLGDAFFDSALDFARRAHAFDPSLSLADLGQALRNVWIGNSLQMLLDLHVGLGPALFAYSMLYPLTDNLLDDPGLPAAAKRSFNAWLGRRLAGEACFARPRSADPLARQRGADALVGLVEEDFPRRRFPDLYASLLAIHGGQVASLRQQGGAREVTDEELLSISCAKGGSSVVADLYVIAGQASVEEERFAFGYGVFLQLLDDLQDVEDDLAAGHETLFTRAARRGALDEPAARLARFIDALLDGGPLFTGPTFADRIDLIRRNCRALLVGAVAERPRRFTRRFRRRLEAVWPLGLAGMRRLRRRAQRRWRRADEALRRRTGSASALELLLDSRR